MAQQPVATELMNDSRDRCWGQHCLWLTITLQMTATLSKLLTFHSERTTTGSLWQQINRTADNCRRPPEGPCQTWLRAVKDDLKPLNVCQSCRGLEEGN